jgi:solute carrier family 24 (sodium/potassium/calcium exchanger), member 6
MALLFSTIGIAASDFLCINLSTIATLLGMSESLTGVTFLAFGNGSPDVFSTFAAMSSHSGSLAIGELMGAAGFITAVVAGSMAITQPFQVARKSFIRDVSFFAVAASFSLFFLADGHLRLWECVVMVAFYVFYVIFVVTWHWWLTSRRRAKLAETSARLHHHIPDTQELEAPEYHDDEEARPTGERTPLVRSRSGESINTLLSNGIPAWKLPEDEDDETRHRYLAELQSNMRVRPRGERRNTMNPIRPSLIGALEFRSVLNSLEKKSTSGSTIGLRRYSEDVNGLLLAADSTISQPELVTIGPVEDENFRSTSGRNRAVSANDAAGLRIDTDLLSPNTEDEAAISSGSVTPTANSSTKNSRPSADILRQLDGNFGRPPSPKLLLSPSGSQHSEGSLGRGRSKSPAFLAPPGMSSSGRMTDDTQELTLSPMTMSPSAGPRLELPAQSRPSLQVPILHSPHPQDVHHKSPLHHAFPAYTDPSGSYSTVSSRPPSIRLPAPSMSPESTHDLGLLTEQDQEMRKFSWWPYHILTPPQEILSTLFPTLYGWRDKGWSDKLLGIVTAPSVFLLAVTLPVVDGDSSDALPDPDPALLTPGAPSRSSTLNHFTPGTPSMPPKRPSGVGSQHPHAGLSRQRSDVAPKTPNADVNEVSGPKDWNRWLVFLQVFTAPFFVVTILWANMDDDHHLLLYLRLVLGALVFSLVCLFILLATTRHDREPKFRPLLCFLGFAVAIAWISTIANEVVGVLKAFGVILNISDAILGLTIFAVGNSCGDLVADITVAKLGFPVMALSACFGGPMLNILLGIGLSGMYMTIRHGMHKHEKHPDQPIHYRPYELDISATLVISGVTLLVTLLGLLIVVPLNGWRMDRKIGIGLITLWSLSTLGNVIVEVLGYGETI